MAGCTDTTSSAEGAMCHVAASACLATMAARLSLARPSSTPCTRLEWLTQSVMLLSTLLLHAGCQHHQH
jgi:hypothetical protein